MSSRTNHGSSSGFERQTPLIERETQKPVTAATPPSLSPAQRSDRRERVVGTLDDFEIEVLPGRHPLNVAAEMLLDDVEPPIFEAEHEKRFHAAIRHVDKGSLDLAKLEPAISRASQWSNLNHARVFAPVSRTAFGNNTQQF